MGIQGKVIPSGLANAPSAFMRHLHRVLAKHRASVGTFIDDPPTPPMTEGEHKRHVQVLSETLREATLKCPNAQLAPRRLPL